LLSAQNVDKTLKNGDASYTQRLQMMVLLAQEIIRLKTADLPHPANAQHPHPEANSFTAPAVAVAIIDEPTFVGKSSKLRRWLRDQQDLHYSQTEFATIPILSFVLGYDTLVRLFNPKYYGDSAAEMHKTLHGFFDYDGSSVICARRSSSDKDENNMNAANEELEFLRSSAVRPYFETKAGITIVSIDPEEARMSSTHVREGVASVPLNDGTKGSSAYSQQAGRSAWWNMTIPSVVAFIEASSLYSSRE
jgi:nicotinamide-nucleotide adenylyltransferase